jgi:hypothetical protein
MPNPAHPEAMALRSLQYNRPCLHAKWRNVEPSDERQIKIEHARIPDFEG